MTATGSWISPVPTGEPVAPPGAHVALGRPTYELDQPTDELLTCMFVGNDQRLWAATATSVGVWQPAIPISSFPFANGGAAVSLVSQCEFSLNTSLNRLTGVTLGNDGQLWVSVVTGTSAFTDPTALPLTNYTTTGTVRPKYQVLAVLYAPPGANGGKRTSTADYTNSQVTGTSNSFTSSFKSTLNVNVNAGIGPDKGDSGGKDKTTGTLGVGGSFSTSKTTSNTSSIQITKTTGCELVIPGPLADGIDHDQDQMLIWLNPLINIQVDGWRNVNWAMSVDGDQMIVQPIYIGQLKDPSTMPADVLKQLTDAGLTQDDFHTIADLNPFAYGNTYIDPNRFKPLQQPSFAYDPPKEAGATPDTGNYTQTDATTLSDASTVTTEYDVGVTVSTSLNAVVFSFGASVGAQFAWTNSSSSGTSSVTTQMSVLTLQGPTAAFTPPAGKDPEILVYWDTVYNTFMCAFKDSADGQ